MNKEKSMEALRLLEKYTSGTCNPFQLSGPSLKMVRRDLIALMRGEPPLVKDCGVWKLAEMFALAFEIPCSNSIMFVDALKSNLA